MKRWRSIFLAAAVAALLPGSAAEAQSRPEWREWNRPVDPFRIADGLYYVGASDIAAYLFITPAGHVLLDGGFPETAEQIVANVERLGFDLRDVRYLINTHAHFDHAGGLAALREATGATLVASEADRALLEAGGKGDFAFGDEATFPPVPVGRAVADGGTIELGGLVLTANLTPGHTKGCTTWSAKVRDGEKTLDAVVICSLTVPSPDRYRLAGNPAYPTIVEDYRASFAKVRSLPCDLFLAAHASFFRMKEKREWLEAGRPGNPFVDQDGYRRFVDLYEERFEELLGEAREEAAAKP